MSNGNKTPVRVLLPNDSAATPAELEQLSGFVLEVYLGVGRLCRCRSEKEVVAERRDVNPLCIQAANATIHERKFFWFRRAYSERHPRAKPINGIHPSKHDAALSFVTAFLHDVTHDRAKAVSSGDASDLFAIVPESMLRIAAGHRQVFLGLMKMKAELRLELATAVGLCERAGGKASDCYVTLQQMASIVNKSKATLERLNRRRKLPIADVKGGKGKSDEWLWSKVRPVLEREYSRLLPEQFPGDKFIRR